MDGKSLDITADILAQLKAILPDVFSEDKIDFQRLKQALGEDVLVHGEHYELNWAGKTEARKEIQKQTTATLVPNRAESVDFDKARHIFIEGENLEVLRTLQKSYFGKVKMIYIDPPYNTGNDSFVYPDDYTERQDEYKKRTGLTNGEGYLNKQNLWKKNVKESGQFHSVWMSMMYPRLYLSRNLLREDGVIFISIDDNEQANLKMLCDEVFGEENFVGQIVWQKKTGAGAKTNGFITLHEYVLCYSKNSELVGEIGTNLSEKMKKMYNGKDEYFEELGGFATWPLDTTSMDTRENLIFPIIHNDIEIWPRKQWLWSKERVEKAQKENKLVFNFNAKENKYSVRFKGYLYDTNGNEKRGKPVSLFIGPYTQEGTKDFQELFAREVFSFPKPVALIKQLFKISFDKEPEDNIILDYFAGSGTTAQAILELNEEDGGNRRFICVQMPEKTEEDSEAYKAGYKTIAEITQSRVKKVIEKLETARIAKTEKQNGELFNGENDTPQYPLGFQSYKLATSNFKHWNKYVTGEQALLEQLDIFQQSEIESSLPENMLYELLIKGGFDLITTIEKLQIDEITNIYNVDKGRLWVFFDKYTPSVKAAILAAKPERLIVLDSCFDGDDVAITNLQLDLRENGIDLTII